MGAAIAEGLRAILRKVEKPGRYVGGEFGAIAKQGAALTVAVSYPDLYEIGMSNSAVRILYSLLNGIPDVACERVFAPALDFEAALRSAGMPLCSLETGRPLHQFDVIGFSFGYELTLTNLMAILDTGGVCVESSRRGPGEPVVLIGGPAATNPVPLGLVADAVFIGEAEGWVPTAFAAMAAMKRRGAGREEILGFLRAERTVWYPGKRGQVGRTRWRGFAATAAQTGFPVPSIRVVQDHGTVEIMRGCPNACRFCHATVFYRPTRMKSGEAIRCEVRALVEGSGYRQITLSSLSSGDFREISGLVRDLNARYARQKVSFSLPSLRIDSLGLGLLREISEVRKSGLTFAVETALPGWQQAVRKLVTLERTIAIMREAKSLGWRAAKFYFMVGLPPACDHDEATPIIEFLRAVRAATGMSLNVNVAAFIPKPHTPWHRSRQIGEEEALARIMAVKKGLAGDGVKIGYHAPILSLLEGIVSRGDERAGLLALDAFRRGARLDAWDEHVRLDVWRQAIAEAGWDVLGETCRARPPGEALPWDTIALGLSASVVLDAPADPQPADSPASGRELEGGGGEPNAAEYRGGEPNAAEYRGGDDSRGPAGRERMPGSTVAWKRILFSFEKLGTAVFVSHLDLMTVFERALARAGYAARFTEGFNPKPRLEFANPLSLGLESMEEIAGIDLHDYDTAERFLVRLNGSLPTGFHVTRSAIVPHDGVSRRRSLMSLYWGSDFVVTDERDIERVIRIRSGESSIRKMLEAEGIWERARVRRIASWATGPGGEPLDYFDALIAPLAPIVGTSSRAGDPG